MSSIAILLATYNSQKYLCAQLDSLLEQTNQDFTVYIRDDGSSDSTLDVIYRYIAENIDKIVLMKDSVKGRKAKGSFMWLLENVKAEYYMFCDHDDYWLPSKVELTLNEMKRCEAQNQAQAVVINTDLQVVDADLRIINPSFWKYSKISRALLSDFNYLCTYNAFTGCTMMLNQRAKELSLPINDKALMHDIWVALKVSAASGVLGYVNGATIKYRQHDDNVVGAMKVGGDGYVASKLSSLGSVIRQNKANLDMVRAVKSCSVIKYLYYKLLYYIKR